MKSSKFDLIYALKLKSNSIGQNIRKKTCDLTPNRAQNDSNNCGVKGFHFACQKTKI